MIQKLCNIGHLFIYSACSALICMASHSTSFAQSIVILKAKSGNITYRLKDDPQKNSCPPERVIKPGMTTNLALQDFIAVCIPPGGKAFVENCPDPKSPTGKKRPQSFVSAYSRIAQKCAPSSGHGSGHTVLGGWDTSIPYIISPRYTKILSNKPVFLSWNRTGENSSYEVVIKSIEKPWSWPWTISSGSKNEVIKILGPEKLEPGTYRLIVKADNGKSSDQEITEDEKIPVSQFRVVSKAEENEIENEVRDFNNNFLDVARIYAEKGFYLEAIQILEDMNEDKKDSETYLFLGSFYSAVGLSASAVKNYGLSEAIYAKEQRAEICTKFNQKNPNQQLPGCPD
jgi:hypothetical protein